MLNACLNSNKLINVAHIKHCTKMKFSIKDFFSKCDQENYFFCAAKKFSQSVNKQFISAYLMKVRKLRLFGKDKRMVKDIFISKLRSK